MSSVLHLIWTILYGSVLVCGIFLGAGIILWATTSLIPFFTEILPEWIDDAKQLSLLLKGKVKSPHARKLLKKIIKWDCSKLSPLTADCDYPNRYRGYSIVRTSFVVTEADYAFLRSIGWKEFQAPVKRGIFWKRYVHVFVNQYAVPFSREELGYGIGGIGQKLILGQ